MPPEKKKSDANQSTPAPSVPVRIPEWLMMEIERVSDRTGRSKQEVIRLASEVGLAALAKVNYNVGEAVARMAMTDPNEIEERKLKALLHSTKTENDSVKLADTDETPRSSSNRTIASRSPKSPQAAQG